jgi:hypothetical protein
MLTLRIRVLNKNLFVITLQKAMKAHNGGLETHYRVLEAYSGVVWAKVPWRQFGLCPL